jgi:hypothetical protein
MAWPAWARRRLCWLRAPCLRLARRPVAAFVLLLLLLLLLQLVALAAWPPAAPGPRGPPPPGLGHGLQHARRGAGRVLGAPAALQGSYIADGQGMFWCLGSQLALPFSQVNDDYCDCPDGSDEPSTSACPSGTFHCSAPPAAFPSSRVNAGVCDCCDGSDEYRSIRPGRPGLLTCTNTC